MSTSFLVDRASIRIFKTTRFFWLLFRVQAVRLAEIQGQGRLARPTVLGQRSTQRNLARTLKAEFFTQVFLCSGFHCKYAIEIHTL
jgi:hypothetical protein